MPVGWNEPNYSAQLGTMFAAFNAERAVGQEIERLVEEIEYQAAVVGDMAADGREACKLVVNRDQVLKGAEGNGDHCEAAAEGEGAHVGLN